MRTYRVAIKHLASNLTVKVDVSAANRDQAIYKATHYPYANMEPSLADLVAAGLAKVVEPTINDLMTKHWTEALR